MAGVDVLIRVIHDLQMPDTARRIASVLQRTTGIGERPIPLTQSKIGLIANASRKQVNAALARFAQTGWVKTDYRSIMIRVPKRFGALQRGMIEASDNDLSSSPSPLTLMGTAWCIGWMAALDSEKSAKDPDVEHRPRGTAGAMTVERRLAVIRPGRVESP